MFPQDTGIRCLPGSILKLACPGAPPRCHAVGTIRQVFGGAGPATQMTMSCLQARAPRKPAPRLGSRCALGRDPPHWICQDSDPWQLCEPRRSGSAPADPYSKNPNMRPVWTSCDASYSSYLVRALENTHAKSTTYHPNLGTNFGYKRSWEIQGVQSFSTLSTLTVNPFANPAFPAELRHEDS